MTMERRIIRNMMPKMVKMVKRTKVAKTRTTLRTSLKANLFPHSISLRWKSIVLEMPPNFLGSFTWIKEPVITCERVSEDMSSSLQASDHPQAPRGKPLFSTQMLKKIIKIFSLLTPRDRRHPLDGLIPTDGLEDQTAE